MALPRPRLNWTSLFCHHHWVRARWEDGSYGLRCSLCMKAYGRTWEQLLQRPPASGPGSGRDPGLGRAA